MIQFYKLNIEYMDEWRINEFTDIFINLQVNQIFSEMIDEYAEVSKNYFLPSKHQMSEWNFLGIYWMIIS